MTDTPQTAYESPCRGPLKGAYFPLNQSNEQATGAILAPENKNLQIQEHSFNDASQCKKGHTYQT